MISETFPSTTLAQRNITRKKNRLFRRLLCVLAFVIGMSMALTAVLAQDLNDILIVLLVVGDDVVSTAALRAIPGGELTFTFSHNTK